MKIGYNCRKNTGNFIFVQRILVKGTLICRFSSVRKEDYELVLVERVANLTAEIVSQGAD